MLAFNKFASARQRPRYPLGFFGGGGGFFGGCQKCNHLFCCLSSFFVSKSESGRIGVKWMPFVMMMLLLLHADFQDHGDNPKWAAPTRPASCLSFGCGNAPGRLGVFF